VPCFEKPARADYVEARLTERGHALLAPDRDSSTVLARIHAPRYLQFLQTAGAMAGADPANAQVQPSPRSGRAHPAQRH
jgi:acetoin utilization deacetylase AcuC-like enzyme